MKSIQVQLGIVDGECSIIVRQTPALKYLSVHLTYTKIIEYLHKTNLQTFNTKISLIWSIYILSVNQLSQAFEISNGTSIN